ncbi:hypothetical protein ACIRS1_05405 [Kitasatospora sp. NPDC101176]|uniref:hypothetical protein n=1 Tax=Kitasatospora sp. NPDC101176 TaxID=3364099 RepID=UPI0037F219C8
MFDYQDDFKWDTLDHAFRSDEIKALILDEIDSQNTLIEAAVTWDGLAAWIEDRIQNISHEEWTNSLNNLGYLAQQELGRDVTAFMNLWNSWTHEYVREMEGDFLQSTEDGYGTSENSDGYGFETSDSNFYDYTTEGRRSSLDSDDAGSDSDDSFGSEDAGSGSYSDDDEVAGIGLDEHDLEIEAEVSIGVSGEVKGSGEVEGSGAGSGSGPGEVEGSGPGSGEVEGSGPGSGEVEGSGSGSGEVEGSGSGEVEGSGSGSGEVKDSDESPADSSDEIDSDGPPADSSDEESEAGLFERTRRRIADKALEELHIPAATGKVGDSSSSLGDTKVTGPAHHVGDLKEMDPAYIEFDKKSVVYFDRGTIESRKVVREGDVLTVGGIALADGYYGWVLDGSDNLFVFSDQVAAFTDQSTQDPNLAAFANQGLTWADFSADKAPKVRFMIRHSSSADGMPVRGAGMCEISKKYVKTESGHATIQYIVSIDPSSGHYKPFEHNLSDSAAFLTEHGFLWGDASVNYGGKYRDGSKAGRTYTEEARKVQAAVGLANGVVPEVAQMHVHDVAAAKIRDAAVARVERRAMGPAAESTFRELGNAVIAINRIENLKGDEDEKD